jgi:hypothetical protein
MPSTQTNGHATPRNHTRQRTPRLSRQEHANKFNGAWCKSVEAIFEASTCLLEAKRDLPPHEYEAMLNEDLAVSGSTARKLILICQNAVLCAHGHKCPPHWRTIYELCQLTDQRLQEAIEADLINPDMERKDAIALKPPRQQRSSSPRTPDTGAAGNGGAAPGASDGRHVTTFRFPDGRTARCQVEEHDLEIRTPYYVQQNGQAPQTDPPPDPDRDTGDHHDADAHQVEDHTDDAALPDRIRNLITPKLKAEIEALDCGDVGQRDLVVSALRDLADDARELAEAVEEGTVGADDED